MHKIEFNGWLALIPIILMSLGIWKIIEIVRYFL